jgi:hypothetical protein
MPKARSGPEEGYMNRRTSGEKGIEDDTEGHAGKMPKAVEDDTEGHAGKMPKAVEDDTEGQRKHPT